MNSALFSICIKLLIWFILAKLHGFSSFQYFFHVVLLLHRSLFQCWNRVLSMFSQATWPTNTLSRNKLVNNAFFSNYQLAHSFLWSYFKCPFQIVSIAPFVHPFCFPLYPNAAHWLLKKTSVNQSKKNLILPHFFFLPKMPYEHGPIFGPGIHHLWHDQKNSNFNLKTSIAHEIKKNVWKKTIMNTCP